MVSKNILMVIPPLVIIPIAFIAEITDHLALSQFSSLMVLSVSLMIVINGIQIKLDMEGKYTRIIDEDIAPYCDMKKMRNDLWRIQCILGSVIAMLCVMLFFLNLYFAWAYVLFFILITVTFFRSLLFNFKRYLADPNNRPNVTFWGYTRP